MTDFDYEILEAVAKYGDNGVTKAELERDHFKKYGNLAYNLLYLSEPPPFVPGIINVRFENETCLKAVEKIVHGKTGDRPERYYFVTNRGQTLLYNWQRRRCHNRIWHIVEGFGFALMGALLGIILSPLLTPFINCLLESAKRKLLP